MAKPCKPGIVEVKENDWVYKLNTFNALWSQFRTTLRV